MAAAAAADSTDELPAWYMEVEKDLECPVCLDSIMEPPIFLCERQHGLRSTCCQKFQEEVSYTFLWLSLSTAIHHCYLCFDPYHHKL